ncbi:hypothetical protein ACF068_07140 [Streptomyces sp. NPDC016309]|uniref:hypothetical protein n=1 Tax=Streptomyces sp. NPDC016309 TaxID=3364965 RepID=UPI0036FF93EE
MGRRRGAHEAAGAERAALVAEEVDLLVGGHGDARTATVVTAASPPAASPTNR